VSREVMDKVDGEIASFEALLNGEVARLNTALAEARVEHMTVWEPIGGLPRQPAASRRSRARPDRTRSHADGPEASPAPPRGGLRRQ
jgi:hypothetical protein